MVGIGPGHRDYVLPIATKTIEAAKVLVGGSRVLEEFASENQKTFPIKGNLQNVMDFIEENLKDNDVVVMVSGDPGYYSMLKSLKEYFTKEKIEVIAGISSMQIAFSKLSLYYQDATLVSFHGRVPKEEDLLYQKGKILGTLTDKKYNSQTIAQYLLARNWDKNCTYHILEYLSYNKEKIITTTLEKAINGYLATHAIIIVEG